MMKILSMEDQYIDWIINKTKLEEIIKREEELKVLIKTEDVSSKLFVGIQEKIRSCRDYIINYEGDSSNHLQNIVLNNADKALNNIEYELNSRYNDLVFLEGEVEDKINNLNKESGFDDVKEIIHLCQQYSYCEFFDKRLIENRLKLNYLYLDLAMLGEFSKINKHDLYRWYASCESIAQLYSWKVQVDRILDNEAATKQEIRQKNKLKKGDKVELIFNKELIPEAKKISDDLRVILNDPVKYLGEREKIMRELEKLEIVKNMLGEGLSLDRKYLECICSEDAENKFDDRGSIYLALVGQNYEYTREKLIFLKEQRKKECGELVKDKVKNVDEGLYLRLSVADERYRLSIFNGYAQLLNNTELCGELEKINDKMEYYDAFLERFEEYLESGKINFRGLRDIARVLRVESDNLQFKDYCDLLVGSKDGKLLSMGLYERRERLKEIKGEHLNGDEQILYEMVKKNI